MAIAPTLQRYPTQMTLEDGTELTIRPLQKEDKLPLAQFFQRIPEEDRFYLKENVTAPEVIQDWIERMDMERVVPISCWNRKLNCSRFNLASSSCN